jgi:hypothetical protein
MFGIGLFEFLNLNDLIADEINEANIQILKTIFHFHLYLLILKILLNIGVSLQESVIYIDNNIQIFGLRCSDLTLICWMMNLKINQSINRAIMTPQYIQTILYFRKALQFHLILQVRFVFKEYLHFANNGGVFQTAVNGQLKSYLSIDFFKELNI